MSRSNIPKQDGGKCHMVDKKESSGEEHLAAYSGVGIKVEYINFYLLILRFVRQARGTSSM